MSDITPEHAFPCRCPGIEGGTIPCLGFGTASLKGEGAASKIEMAINEGYRMIDTALLYGNQKEVGEAVKNCKVPREDLWITTKVSFFPPGCDSLWMFNPNNVVGEEMASIDLSLQLLDMTYVDLCLLHNPCATATEYNLATLPHFFELFNVCGYDSAIKPEKLHDGTNLRDFIMESKRHEISNVDKRATFESRKKSWKELENALSHGKCKRIGVSNYTAELLLEMKEYAEVLPSVNQLEYHPRYSSPELLKVCREMNIALIGYGTGHYLAIEKSIEEKTKQNNQVLDCITTRTGKSRLQVLLRWMFQLGIVSIPRSGNPLHMRENRDIFDFELNGEEMELMECLNENHPYYWDPIPSNMTIIEKSV